MDKLSTQIIIQGIYIKNMLDYKNIKKSDLKDLLEQTLDILSSIENSDNINSVSKNTIQEYKNKFEKVLK